MLNAYDSCFCFGRKKNFFWFFICIYSTTTITFDVLKHSIRFMEISISFKLICLRCKKVGNISKKKSIVHI